MFWGGEDGLMRNPSRCDPSFKISISGPRRLEVKMVPGRQGGQLHRSGFQKSWLCMDFRWTTWIFINLPVSLHSPIVEPLDWLLQRIGKWMFDMKNLHHTQPGQGFPCVFPSFSTWNLRYFAPLELGSRSSTTIEVGTSWRPSDLH